jgi:hypothetical protein
MSIIGDLRIRADDGFGGGPFGGRRCWSLAIAVLRVQWIFQRLIFSG